MEDYSAFAGNLSNDKWAKKYYELKRNYDSVTRICKGMLYENVLHFQFVLSIHTKCISMKYRKMFKK